MCEAPDEEQKQEAFKAWTGVQADTEKIHSFVEIAKNLYQLITPKPNERALPVGLASSSLDVAKMYNTDQDRYQAKFKIVVDSATVLIAKNKSFSDCLAYIAHQRHQMAGYSTNLFGVSRIEEAGTGLFDRYQKYLEMFLCTSKSGWEKVWTPSGATYIIKHESLMLTTIWLSDSSARWYHTPPENIGPALEKAQHLYDRLSIQTSKPLEELMKDIAELHWWIAQACPYARGSAAIAKMMVGAILKHHGYEAGGFGDIEPDCMALIQNLEEFKAGYLKLMQYPAPKKL
jgi:hypothetical protein